MRYDWDDDIMLTDNENNSEQCWLMICCIKMSRGIILHNYNRISNY